MLAQIEKWDYFEYSLLYQGSGNSFLDVSLEATFIHPNCQAHTHQQTRYGIHRSAESGNFETSI